MSTPAKAPSRKEVVDELWSRGILSFKLDAAQKIMYEKFYKNDHKVQTWLLSRRAGKTFLLCVLALEQCLRKPRSIVKFLSPTKLQVATNVRPLFEKLLDDCPADLKPKMQSDTKFYLFPNGSEIQLAGTDGGHAEKLRGGDSDVWFVDEAGSCDDLTNIVKSILLPTTLITRGKGVLASTPPKEPDHDFITFIERAEERGSLTKMTIDDNPRLTNEQKEELFLELGGKHTEEARRELYCELIRDPSVVVIPEFTPEIEKECVKEWPRPPYFDCYEAMDLGFNDLTALVFGYYDFRADKIIIEDEYTVNGTNLQVSKLVRTIQEKEEALWYDPISGETKKPYLRVSDINYIVQNEIRVHSNNDINFIATKKDDKDAAINSLRMMIGGKKVIIHPRCTQLIRHLKNVKWASRSNKKQFARSQDDGHYDLVDALIYFVRSIVFSKNPYPSNYGVNFRDAFGNAIGPRTQIAGGQSQLDAYRAIFNVKVRK